MENTQKSSETNTTYGDINAKEVAPAALSVPLEETQGLSDWASTTLDALGPVINTPYPVDKLTDTDASTESNAPDEVNDIQKNHIEEQTSDDTHIELITINKQAATVTYITRKENQDVPGAYVDNSEEFVQGEPSTLFQDAKYVRDMVAETLDHDAQYVKDVTAGAFESARGYAVKTGEAVGGYLPQSVTAYLRKHTLSDSISLTLMTLSCIPNNDTTPVHRL